MDAVILNKLLCITDDMSNVVTVRVSRLLKKRMDRLAHINWSGLIRDFIARTVEEEERKLNRYKDKERMQKAAQEMDRLAELSGAGWVGSEEVIKWRKKRYSYLTQA